MDMTWIGGTVAAVVVGTAVLCLLGGWSRRGWAAGTWAVLLALAVAPLATDRPFLGERPQWREADTDRADAVQRIILAVFPLAGLAAALATRRLPAWASGVLAAAAPVAIGRWVLAAWPTPPVGWPALAAAAVASGGLWLLVEPLAVRRPTGVAAPWVCGCLAAGVGLVNLYSSATAPAWVAVATGGVVGGTFLFALTGRGPSFARGPVAVVVPLLVCAVLANRIGGGNVPTSRWLLLAAAPVAAWAAEIKPVRGWRPWLREPLRMAVVAVPVVVAVVPAYRAWKVEQDAETGPNWSMAAPPGGTVATDPAAVQPPAPTLPRPTPMASTIRPPTITCTTVLASGVAM